MRRRTLLPLFLAGASALFLAGPASAVIMVLTPLKAIIEKEQYIFVAKVGDVLPDKPALVLVRAENLKGEAPFERMPVNLTGNAEAQKGKHAQVLLDRVEKDLPIVVFVHKKGKRYEAFGFTNGTWFAMEGRIDAENGKDVVRWALQSAEPYLRRTFKGTTAELRQIIIDGLARKKDPPEPNEKEPPGFGDPIKKNSSLGIFPPLAVVQIPFIGLIAGLAALFPTVFGGLAILMRRWMALLSVASITSIIYFLHLQMPKWIRWTGIETMATVWIVCAALSGVGALWAARRYRKAVAAGKGDEWQPRKIDRIGLAVLSLVGVASIGVAVALKTSLLSWFWPSIVVCSVGLAAGTYYVFAHYLRVRRAEPRPALSVSAESVMLWAALVACAWLGALETGRGENRQSGVALGDAQGSETALRRVPTPLNEFKPKWVFQPKENGEILSTPCQTPDHVVVSVFHNEGLSQFGRVYALDPATGAEKWRFPNDRDPNNEEEMLPVFCSPVYADGRIYVGEGFHKDQNCRLLCLDAATGKKLWEKKTSSHTESTPAVADGLVAFGAGNDGIYILDAKTGDEVWHYTGTSGLHIDANPVIADGLVYAASGFSRTHQVNRIFCLDPKQKREVWGERVELSAYGSPAYYDGKVYFAIGNSTFSEHRDPARGMVLCRDAKTGEAVWDKEMPETVICKPAVDRQCVYVGCWDGNCYALDRHTGKEIWEKPQPLDGGPGCASPVIDRCSVCQTSEVLYVCGKTGAFKALSPQTGKVFWSLDLRAVNPDLTKIDLDGSPLVVREEKGTTVRRRIYLPAGLAQSAVALPVARLYCYEDATDHSKP